MSLDAGRVGVRADQVDIHGRVTSPSFLNELLEDLPEWTDMPVWVNGTEELLPSNNSVPVTSPILADIAYPDIRRDNQYFTYRESPTPVDGLAKIKSIKGNTLKWNQLVNLIISSTTTGGITYTVSGGEFTINGTATETLITKLMNDYQFQSGHKYLFKGIPSSASGSTHRLDLRQTSDGGVIRADIRENTIISIGTTVSGYITLRVQSGAVISNAKYAPQIFDLTMLGIDNLTDNEVIKWFADYFPLSYYSYNAGTLLSFNGTGLKTAGKNLLQVSLNPGSVIDSIDENGYITSKDNFPVGWQLIGSFYAMPNTQYTISATDGFANSYSRLALGLLSNISPTSSRPDSYADTNIGLDVLEALTPSRLEKTFISNKSQLIYVWLCSDRANTGSYPKFTFACQVEFGSTATDYEPYTSSTSSLPISTYFPTGMKSAGTVYDELTPRKAITKLSLFEITSANIQSSYLDTQNNQWLGFISVPNIKQITNEVIKANILCNTLETKNQGSLFGEVGSAIALLVNSTNVRITIKGITTFADMQTWLDNNPTYFVYELATPVELPTLSLGE